MENKKVLVIFTGGTIGSVKVYDKGKKQNILVQPSKAKEFDPEAKDLASLLLSVYKEQFPSDFNSIETISIMEEFSENFTIDTLAYLTRELRKINLNNYKGVVITHGTDTLGYTANYLAMVLNDVKIPVMVVGSNYPVNDPKANGIINFKAALDFINFNIPGVYVTYCNDISSLSTNIIYASRVTQCQAPTDTFGGVSYNKPNMLPLATININGNLNVVDDILFNKLVCKTPTGKSYINHMVRLNSKILLIQPYVGINYDYFNLTNDISAILHTFYHSGTACTRGNACEKLDSFIKNCRKKGVDLYLGPVYGKSDQSIYDTMTPYVSEKIIMNTSVENAYIKMLIAYHLFDKAHDIDSFLFSDINEEHISESYRLKFR